MRHRNGQRCRAAAFVAGAIAVALAAAPASAEHIKLGLVRVANSGATYIAQEKGYFAAEGLEAELIFFEGGAVPITIAIVSGDIDVGETATSASLFTLAGQGAIKIVGGETREAKGFHNFALAASNHGLCGGVEILHRPARPRARHPADRLQRALSPVAARRQIRLRREERAAPPGAVDPERDLVDQGRPGRRHHQRGDVTHAALRERRGEAPRLAQRRGALPIGDHLRLDQDRERAPRHAGAVPARFAQGLQRLSRCLHRAGEIRADGPAAAETLAIISKYTGETPERTKVSIAYAPANGGLDFKDIERQIDWFKAQGMIKGAVDSDAVIDRRYATDLPVQ